MDRKRFFPNQPSDHDVHVVARLKTQLSRARAMGLNVRMELLSDEQATWCEIAGRPTLFVDLGQSAAEQLRQVEETLEAFQASRAA